ncbi:MAG TPA: DUF1707 domain-containing protein [Solirubrobacteraceae bacterium]|nr:DUF1707 domain-containing protein [Solirubrobacteraceae bacterium]
MAGRAALRASDSDREHVAERLREAATEGRLLTEELEQRLEVALSARTYGQLNAVLHDLPGRGLGAPAERRSRSLARSTLTVALALAVAIAVLVTVVFVVTGVFAGWLLWLAAGWLFFGRRRRRLYGGRYRGRSLHACGSWSAGRTRGFSA